MTGLSWSILMFVCGGLFGIFWMWMFLPTEYLKERNTSEPAIPDGFQIPERDPWVAILKIEARVTTAERDLHDMRRGIHEATKRQIL